MDINELIKNSIENLVASLPEIVVVILMIFYYLRGIKNKTTEFPAEVLAVKNNFVQKFTELKDHYVGAFANTEREIKESMDTAVVEIRNSIQKSVTQISENVTETLSSMQTELNQFKEELTSNANLLKVSNEQRNVLARQNMLYMDVISTIVSADPKMVEDGIATIVAKKLNMTKKQLLEYPEQIINDIETLEKSLVEIVKIAGEQTLTEMLERIGYYVEKAEPKERTVDGETV